MTTTAQDFLARSFAPGETIAFLLRSRNPPRIFQRIVTFETAIGYRFLGWMAHLNHHGANIYVAPNPLIPGSQQSTRENIASVRHLYIDIGTDGDARLATLRASDAVPPASAIIATSPGKYQVLWHVNGFDFERQERTLKLLAAAFGGDPARTDCNRVIRVPGFLNEKYDPSPRVSVTYSPECVWTPKHFHLSKSAASAGLPARALPSSRPPAEHSNSEDWAWVMAELERGVDAHKLTGILAKRRADRPDHLDYAQRTVDMASALQWTQHGAPIEDVIAMLRKRRDDELTDALGSVRAREIATAAQRIAAYLAIA